MKIQAFLTRQTVSNSKMCFSFFLEFSHHNFLRCSIWGMLNQFLVIFFIRASLVLRQQKLNWQTLGIFIITSSGYLYIVIPEISIIVSGNFVLKFTFTRHFRSRLELNNSQICIAVPECLQEVNHHVQNIRPFLDV